MAGLVRDSPDADVTVPPTIQALLAARLDQLDPSERGVLERGSVEGRVFHRGAVQALSPSQAELVTPLTALVRRELVRPDRAQLPGEDAYRFRHLLIRDAAYEALPKATRADLHERFAAWIGAHGSGLVELDEVVGYHLEQAFRYRAELGPAGEEGRALAERAADRLASAGRRASGRGDLRGAVSLLGRAEELFAPDDPRRLAILPVLGRALHDSGDWTRAHTILSDAIARARATGDRRVEADARVSLAHLDMFNDPSLTHDGVRATLAEPLRVFEELGDEAGLARALGLTGQLRFWAGDSAHAIADLERAAVHARAAGDRQQESQSLGYVVISCVHGSTPVDEALEVCRRARDRGGVDRRLEVASFRGEGNLHAMAGRIEDARASIETAMALAKELGLNVMAASVEVDRGRIEDFCGDPVAAERLARPGLDALERIGNHGHWVTGAITLADALFEQGRLDEAEAVTDQVDARSMADDTDPQIGWRRTKAKVLARRGELAAAERFAREAVAIASRTDYLENRALAHADLAVVLEAAGRRDEARAELERAVDFCEQKGIVPFAARYRAALAAF
jgi:tetratricopeptide (TPR) repeat protein